MDVASEAAIALIPVSARSEGDREKVALFMSEAPIGDEYGLLDDDGWRLGAEFLDWLSGLGVEPWEPSSL